MSETPGNGISGAGAAIGVDERRRSLPSARSAYAMASCDPIESPSGRACDESTNRCRAAESRSTQSSLESRGTSSSSSGGAGWRLDLVEQLLDPILSGNRFVVDETSARGSASAAGGRRSGGAETVRAGERPFASRRLFSSPSAV